MANLGLRNDNLVASHHHKQDTMTTYQGIADRLIQDGYLLTALELHTELSEHGKSIKSLKEFFEDSSNFEKFLRQPNSKKSPSPAPSISSITGSQVSLSMPPYAT